MERLFALIKYTARGVVVIALAMLSGIAFSFVASLDLLISLAIMGVFLLSLLAVDALIPGRNQHTAMRSNARSVPVVFKSKKIRKELESFEPLIPEKAKSVITADSEKAKSVITAHSDIVVSAEVARAEASKEKILPLEELPREADPEVSENAELSADAAEPALDEVTFAELPIEHAAKTTWENDALEKQPADGQQGDVLVEIEAEESATVDANSSEQHQSSPEEETHDKKEEPVDLPATDEQLVEVPELEDKVQAEPKAEQN
jgi:hypothetical protein